jgi:hypothetical protein
VPWGWLVSKESMVMFLHLSVEAAYQVSMTCSTPQAWSTAGLHAKGTGSL